MLYFFIGTKAQFIKMAPIIIECDRRRIDYRYIDSGQHSVLTGRLRKVFGIREPDFIFRSGNDVSSFSAALVWIAELLTYLLFRRHFLRKHVFPIKGICLIHGDTVSTLMGLFFARAAGLQVGHIESGLRSFSLLHPFPEEIVRIFCMKRCDLLFAPTTAAAENLETLGVKGRIYEVTGNTVEDSIKLARATGTDMHVPSQPFLLACFHRLETINSRRRLQNIVELLNYYAQQIHVVLVLHNPTEKALRRSGSKLSDNVETMSMLDYMDFISLMLAARGVLSDGGSIQEECASIGKPCLILRMRTERQDGLGNTAMLWEFSDSKRDLFMEGLTSPPPQSSSKEKSPSKAIVDILQKTGANRKDTWD